MMRALASSQLSAPRGGVSIRRSTAANATIPSPPTKSLAAAARLPLPRQKHHHYHSLRCPPCAAGAPSQPGRKRGPGEEGSEAEALLAAAESSVDAPAKKVDESPSSSSEAASGNDSDDSAVAAAAAREQQAAARAASAGADTPGGGLSPADLARIRAARAADKEGGASPSSSSSGAGIGSGFFGDVLAEAKLIEWPSLKQALGDTVLVVGIVLGSALLLFVVNTLLADLSKVIY